MTERLLEGTLTDTPFPRILFRIWQRENSGRVRLQKKEEEKFVYIDKGRVTIEQSGLDQAEFLATLAAKRVLPAEQAKRCESYAAAKNVSLIRALSELGLINPLPLWNLMESFYVRQIFDLFEWEEGRFSLEPGVVPDSGCALGYLPTLGLIFQGIRQMQNTALVERTLPEETEPLYISIPYFLHLLNLEPHEKYILNALSAAPNLQIFYGRCELGKKESQKILLALACMDILSSPEKTGKGRAEPATAEQGKILTALNEKCAHIHKFITKQIGPLAHTIIGNCLEEIKPGLGPLFQKMKLLEDGRIEVDTAIALTLNHLSEDLFKSLVKGFDEILMAEVLAVKKSLGAAHETSLVNSLEKIGCL